MNHIKFKLLPICVSVLFANVFCLCLNNERVNSNSQNISTLKNRKKYSAGSFDYELSNDVSCYSIDISELSNYKKYDVDNYLEQGGVILVNNEAVTVDDFQQITTDDIGTVGFADSEKKGSFIFQNNEQLELWSYNLDFFNDTDVEDSETIAEMTKNAEDEITIEDIIEWILEFIEKLLDFWKNHESDDSSSNQLTELGTARTVVMVPLLSNPRVKVCSYQITATVRQGQKYLDEYNIRRGIYDITTQFGVDAEPNYAITEYTPYISSSEEIIDATYLYSDVQTQYTLGGELGFDGEEVGAKVDFNYSYTGSSTDQDVVNNFPYGCNYRTWKMTPYQQDNFDASYISEPGIRVLSKNDKKIMSASLKFATLKARSQGWWFFYDRLTLDDSYRYTLTLNWTADEEISYTENLGD